MLWSLSLTADVHEIGWIIYLLGDLCVCAVYRPLSHTDTCTEGANTPAHTPAQLRTRMHANAQYFPYWTSLSVAKPACMLGACPHGLLIFSEKNRVSINISGGNQPFENHQSMKESIDFNLNNLFGTSIEHTNQLGLDSVFVTKTFFFCCYCISLPSRNLMSIWDNLNSLVCMGFAPLVWADIDSVWYWCFIRFGNYSTFIVYIIHFHP